MVVYLEKMMERLNSGDSKILFRTILCILDIGLMKHGRASWQKEEETIKYFRIVLILQEKFFTSELFKVIQDAILLILHCRTNVIIPDDFLEYIYHVGCAINLHSIIDSGLIPGGQKIEQKTDSILSACESYG